jgi:hypothetical protein
MEGGGQHDGDRTTLSSAQGKSPLTVVAGAHELC